MGSVVKQAAGGYRARYRDATGKEHGRRFKKATEARAWVADQEAAVRRGDHVDTKTARMTVDAWLEKWLEGYASRRASTLRQAKVHARVISAEFGSRRLGDIRPSEVSSWVARLGETYADSTRYAIYRRFAQVMGDAVQDGLIPRSPCSRRTAPPQGAQRPGVATVEQIWQLHDVMDPHLRPAVLLGAFAGLRVSEVCGLRVGDIDLMRGIVSPEIQWGGGPLKSACSRASIPIPQELALMLAQYADQGPTFLSDDLGEPVGPWVVERAMRKARQEVADLPDGFRHHDLRHTFASLLIAAGLDVKTVQNRMRHASAVTTLNAYGHMFPDTDDRTRDAVAAVMRPAANLRPVAK